MTKERLLLPFGVYDTNRCAMCWIGLYENEDDCWTVFLGWPDKEEIEDAKKRGYVVLPLMVNYQPPKTEHEPVRLSKDGAGGFEVRFNDGRPSRYFPPGEIEAAKKFAREERDKLTQQERKMP